jgi:ABC-type antimicrobial peptide transport system permease subunit
MMLLGVGCMVGLLLSSFAGWLLQRIVYQANPRDPVVLLGVVLMMTFLGVAASAIPALRAISIDPSKLLREE